MERGVLVLHDAETQRAESGEEAEVGSERGGEGGGGSDEAVGEADGRAKDGGAAACQQHHGLCSVAVDEQGLEAAEQVIIQGAGGLPA